MEPTVTVGDLVVISESSSSDHAGKVARIKTDDLSTVPFKTETFDGHEVWGSCPNLQRSPNIGDLVVLSERSSSDHAGKVARIVHIDCTKVSFKTETFDGHEVWMSYPNWQCSPNLGDLVVLSERSSSDHAGKVSRIVHIDGTQVPFKTETFDGHEVWVSYPNVIDTNIHQQNSAVLRHRAKTGTVRAPVTNCLALSILKLRGWADASSREVEYLLVSAPEHDKSHEFEVLEHAKYFVKELGYDNVAGDAKDRFHKEVMDADRMTLQLKAWRDAWKGKVCAALQQIQRFRPGIRIFVITIDGGVECQWEVQELCDKIIPQFKDVNLRQCSDFDAFLDVFLSN